MRLTGIGGIVWAAAAGAAPPGFIASPKAAAPADTEVTDGACPIAAATCSCASFFWYSWLKKRRLRDGGGGGGGRMRVPVQQIYLAAARLRVRSGENQENEALGSTAASFFLFFWARKIERHRICCGCP